MAVDPVKAERGAPVVDDQNKVAVEPKGIEPGVEIAHMVNEAVGAAGSLARIAHANEVGGKTAACRRFSTDGAGRA